MNAVNFEVKVKCIHPEKIESILIKQDAWFKGEDHQIDTYFNSGEGKLKLREGKIENALIHYERNEVKGQKRSEVTLFKTGEDVRELKEILSKSIGIKNIVEKTRKIFYIDSIKFHIDTIINLGSFVEIEVIDSSGKADEEKLKAQCDHYIKMLGLENAEFIDSSYSDMSGS